MRTFEFKDDTSNKFWNIEVVGTYYQVRFGKIGSKGQTQRKTFATNAAAQAEADKLIREKLKKGYVETSAAPATPAAPPKPVSTEQKALEAALLAHPDEVAAHSAYADYLSEQGDPRGEFIQAQLALEDPSRGKTERAALAKREAELLKEHAAEWTGAAGRYLVGEWSGDGSPYGYRFARGWLDVVRTLPQPEELTDALAAAPEARMLRRLEIVYDMRFHPFEFGQFTEKLNASLPDDEQLDDEDWYMSDSASLLPNLAKSPYLTNLRVLKYGFSDDHKDGPTHSTMVSPFESNPDHFLNLLKACPRLEELYLNTDLQRIEEVFASELLGKLKVFQYYYGTAYHVYPHPPEAYPLSALAENTTLTNLHTLRFHPGRDSVIALDEFTALVRSPNLPALRHLQVHVANLGQEGIEALTASGILKCLKTLDLAFGGLTDAEAHALAACPDLKNLTTLNVSRNALSSFGVAALARTGVAVVADEQYTPDGEGLEYRFNIDWE